MEILFRLSNHESIYSICLFISFFGLVLLKLIFNKDFKYLIYNDIKNQVSDNSYLIEIFINLLFIISLSFLFFRFTNFSNQFLFINNSFHLLLLLLIFLIYLLFNYVFNFLFFYCFGIYAELRNFNKQKTFFKFWKHVIVILLIIWHSFVPHDFSHTINPNTSILILSVIFLIEWGYLFIFNSFRISISWYYKILYLFSLEILPLLVIYKIFFRMN